MQVSTLLTEVYEIIRRHRLTIPSNLSLMLKALVTIEGLGRTLYPEFDFVSEVQPYLHRITLRRYDPRRRFREFVSTMDEWSRFVEELPRDMSDFIKKTNRGQLKVQFEHRNLKRIAKEVSQSSNRISSALIIASLIIGSSLVMQVPQGPYLFGFPLLGIIGYLLASLFGLKLLWDISRSKNQ